MDHVCVVVDDLDAAKEFFTVLGLELVGDGTVEGETVDRVVGLEGVRSDIAMMRTPDGHSQIELVKYLSPPSQGGDSGAPPNTFGINHLTFAVDDVNAALADLQPHGAELVGEVASTETATSSVTSAAPRGSSWSWRRSWAATELSLGSEVSSFGRFVWNRVGQLIPDEALYQRPFPGSFTRAVADADMIDPR